MRENLVFKRENRSVVQIAKDHWGHASCFIGTYTVAMLSGQGLVARTALERNVWITAVLTSSDRGRAETAESCAQQRTVTQSPSGS